ncbi:LytR/AlgR family response regulator transcription factor [Pseudobacter ginsenosidimutans]|uniref:LytTR family two component transcriptional regulator n=1 Tax=Pseudobacter ginsenosidimutans TaxID=661488 RepID=A0A4Q7MXD1_9BACT|nr:LytTR family DNA-binding domain-containing protein [Pseudobacter ginsenosidimutans]QEC40553.1 response regulator transcription factor [Pseudobacter ginsenosidimutans]RZS72734.1 LytTR family two component transcriptional regulator [Pseudobacter ginsenosidimutans]
MNTINCILVDDEPLNLDGLEKMINRYCPELTVVGKATSAKEALELIRAGSPQIVFLDIQMPRENAFDLLDKLMPVNFEIIFVTAFDNYALRAFRYSALDYLLKPVDMDELRTAVQKARTKLMEKDVNMRLAGFLDQIREKSGNSRIALKTKEGLIFYPIKDILYCTAERAYTRFTFVNSKQLLVSGNLKEFEILLPEDNFCRVHDSYLINLDHVKKYHYGKGGYVEMADGVPIDVSSRKRAAFLAKLRY